MIKKLTNFLGKNKVGIAVLSMLMCLPVVGTHVARAAADAEFTGAMASSSAIVNDNVGAVFSYIVTTWGKGFLIGLILAVLGLTTVIIIGAVFRRRKGKKG